MANHKKSYPVNRVAFFVVFAKKHKNLKTVNLF